MSQSELSVRPNKEQIKREIKILNNLGKQLIALPEGSLKKIPISDVMREAIADGKRFKRGALQRQLRRIASLMQHEDIKQIQDELNRLLQPSKQHTAVMHKIEKWRDDLIAGDDALLTQLIDQFPSCDRQYIRQLVRNASKERTQNKPVKSARALFQYLFKLENASVSSDDQSEGSQGLEGSRGLEANTQEQSNAPEDG